MGTSTTREGFRPVVPLTPPPLYAWPPRPLVAARWFVAQFMFPWGFAFIALAVVSWAYLTPGFERMAVLEVDWMALIWLRNAVLLTLVAGSLHWWLYVRRGQGMDGKYDGRWPEPGSQYFLWRDQAKDNMFWSLASGCTIWSLYEALTLWFYASGRIAVVEWSEAPVYLSAMVVAAFFWATFHFYVTHRLTHWPPLYRLCHELHHRSVSPGPWTGISMHPIEHLFYLSVVMIYWVVPVHPVIIIMAGFFNAIVPALTHSGFEFLQFGRLKLPAGNYFHQLHHRLFKVNYGHPLTPVDKLVGSWHDGTDEAPSAAE